MHTSVVPALPLSQRSDPELMKRYLLLLALLLALPTSSAWAQALDDDVHLSEEGSLRLTLLAGYTTVEHGEECKGRTEAFISDFSLALQYGLNQHIHVRAFVQYEGKGWPWPPDSGRSQMRSGAAFYGLMDLKVPLDLGTLVIEPYVGAGFSILQEGDFDSDAPSDAVILQQQTAPVVSFGGGLRYPLTDRLSLEAMIRQTVHFVGEQTLEDRQGATFELDNGTRSTTQFMGGLSVRL